MPRMLALAMGATKILGTGRNVALLNRVKALSPQRIEVFAVDDSKGGARRARRSAGGLGEIA